MQEKFEVASIMTESSNTTQYCEISENNIKQQKKMFSYLERKKMNRKPINIVAAKNFPNYFFICFMVIFCAQILQFVPEIANMSYKFPKYALITQNKGHIKYFSEFLGDLNIFCKIGVIVEVMLLFSIIVALLSIIKRISSEIVKDKLSHMLIYLSGITYSLSLLGLTFYEKEFNQISKNIKLVDNILFILHVMSAYSLALLLHYEIHRVNISEQLGRYRTENSEIVENSIKTSFVFLMGIQTVLYTLSLLLVSYYTPVTNVEKFLEFGLIVCVNINSIFLPLTFACFIICLKKDLTSAIITLEYKQNEYFIDIDEDTKNML